MMPPVGHGPDATCRAGSSPQISNDTAVPNGRTTGCSTRRAFPPPRGRRAASQLAPRAGHACSASRTTLHKLRHAGSRWRAASKLQATDAICSPRCMEFNQRDFRRAARVPRSCRDVYFGNIQSISLTHRPVYYTFVGHAGDTTSTSPIQSFAGVDQQ